MGSEDSMAELCVDGSLGWSRMRELLAVVQRLVGIAGDTVAGANNGDTLLVKGSACATCLRYGTVFCQ